MTRAALTLAVLLSLGAVPSLAADAGVSALEYTAPAAPAAPDLGGLVLRLVGLTAAILILCVGVLWFARRTNRPHATTGDANGRLRYEGMLVLDRRSAVHLIRVDGQAIAVTTDATGLRSIVVLSEPFEATLAATGTGSAEGEREAA